LHFGSVVAAVGSFLQARSQGGRWLVRIDDLDPPREQAGAASSILRTLESLGMLWDEQEVFQSNRQPAYDQALDLLTQQAYTFPCACTRISAPYPGTCRNGLPTGKTGRSIRVRTGTVIVTLHDKLQGTYRHSLKNETGDFIVRRADGLTAYHLAVVVDDAAQGITEVMRGSDLLDSTPRQNYLQDLLGLSRPSYAHLPVATNGAGIKLSKQTGAPAVDDRHPVPLLFEVLNFLGQTPPRELLDATVEELLGWGAVNWRLDAVPRKAAEKATLTDSMAGHGD